MSAVIVKGIIISLSVVAAVGIALQSPEVREWLEEQRRKLVEILQSLSDTLEPHVRSQAEAFAYEGRLPTQQEMQGIDRATAVATGREVDAEAPQQRRLQRQSSGPTVDAAERRRLGREYLAKRNQELLDLKKKRRSEIEGAAASSKGGKDQAVKALENAISAGTFDQLINDDGSLKLDAVDLTIDEARNVSQGKQAESAPVAARGFELGSSFGNPFGDEFATESFEVEGSRTPRPPVPPKIALGETLPGSFPPDPPVSEPPTGRRSPVSQSTEELSYDEQLARALSLSLAENEEHTRNTLTRRLTEEEEFDLAIQQSLKEAHMVSMKEAVDSSSRGPLVDFSSDAPQRFHAPPQMTSNPWSVRSEDEDLYTLTPMVTGARPIRSLDAQLEGSTTMEGIEASTAHPRDHSVADSSDFSPLNLTSSQTLSPLPPMQPLSPMPAMSPSSATLSLDSPPRDPISSGFQSDSEGDDFASLPPSTTMSIESLVDVEVEDVDIDSMSDDDGIRTPQSWTDVESDVAESERSEQSEADDMVRV